MKLNILERLALTVVGIEIHTQPMSPDIPALWPKFVARIGEIENAIEPNVTYGVMQGGPKTLRYMAAIAVSNAGRVPPGMTVWALPAGRYATFKYPLSGLQQGFCEIFDVLIPGSGETQSGGPQYERYDAAFNPANPKSIVEIGIPLK